MNGSYKILVISSLSAELDQISNWTYENLIKINKKKCKELRINFPRDPPVLTQLTIVGIPIEVGNSYKLLGLQIQDDMKWSEHIDIIMHSESCKTLVYSPYLKA